MSGWLKYHKNTIGPLEGRWIRYTKDMLVPLK